MTQQEICNELRHGPRTFPGDRKTTRNLQGLQRRGIVAYTPRGRHAPGRWELTARGVAEVDAGALIRKGRRTVSMNIALYQRFKNHAARQGKSPTRVLDELLNAYLDEQGEPLAKEIHPARNHRRVGGVQIW